MTDLPPIDIDDALATIKSITIDRETLARLLPSRHEGGDCRRFLGGGKWLELAVITKIEHANRGGSYRAECAEMAEQGWAMMGEVESAAVFWRVTNG